MNRVRAVIFALGLVFISAPANGGESLQKLFGWKPGESCTLRYSGGGKVEEFRLAAIEADRECGEVRVDGPCLSACTKFLDFVSPEKVCATKWARLGFHIGPPVEWPTIEVTKEVMPGAIGVRMESLRPSYSPRIQAWIEKRGGLSRMWLTMSAEEAAKIWRHCPKE